MRRPSGDSSTLPTERSRERSLLLKPCALLNGAMASRPGTHEKHKTARRKIRRERDCIECSPSALKDASWFLVIPKANGIFLTPSIGPSNQPKDGRRPSGGRDRRENGQQPGPQGTSPEYRGL